MSGFVNKAVGSVESGVGKMLGDEDMQMRGEKRANQGHGEQKIQEDKARAQANMDDAKNSSMAQKTKGAGQQAGGALKEGMGKMTGNKGMEAAGHSTRTEGIGRADKA
ncbi:hypothetical protein GGH19_000012 [Coemansia sp. RSA 1807]|nr:hypothetical protein LPJ62_000255 [Coemansia sp. RSA 2167]KAJ2133607.1 hypothetical protein GGF48_000110 [Coemansia sp. RSA 921]KAJ2149147.1 hypothetical protein IW142_000353 [Coemansia sp. RSA 564]KAJ2186942.1 hypothetical protein EV181_003033 [Coemansia sp. RSA 532]KAJ2197163.1 hypothetical protein GGH18_001404 [Coemansia sp. RSA 530]KAJ2220515.1 hypothetical protein IW143_002219 [Coemansia sp. RSA 520]KAJ2274434.1 hypothetical protein GGH14_004096 [Coemansia sp. RSA 370]KAJ2282117.1 hy